MDHKSSSKYLESPPFSLSHAHGKQQGMRKLGNPFVDTSSKSEFVSSFPLPLPVANNNIKHGPAAYNKRNNNGVVEAPSTPGRPVFSFSIVGNNPNTSTGNNGSRKKLVPSKWNDAEKWLVSDTTQNQNQNHHLDGFVKSADFVSRKSSSSSSSSGFGINRNPHHRSKVISSEQKVSTFKDHHHHHHNLTASDSFNVVKDKFTNELEPNLLKLECLEPLSESFLFKEAAALEVESRDIGTEMTPLGSSTTSRCPTPFKTMSPPRHNTPASRSGPLSVTEPTSSLDMGELQDCHLAKLRLETPFDSGVSNWSTREEEEEDISKSLRHFEMSNEYRKSISESRACAWEEEEKTKCCLRYQREEAKIQAWVDLQNAKAEAESRKLEVKIQKMRSKFEEKMMRKTADVHRKAEELRAAAQLDHTDQMHKAKEQANKTINQPHLNVHFSGCSCSCFPCNTNIHH